MTKQMHFFQMKVCYTTTVLPLILIELQKAFDTIDHEILLKNLKAIRF